MRSSSLLLFALVAFVAAMLSAGTTFAEDSGPGHDQAGRIVLDDFEVAERQRVQYLWSLIVCACPRENWSKTLANCPDACADRQKQQVMEQVGDGWSDGQILDAQKAEYSSKALAKPDDLMTYLLPALVFVVSLGILFLVWMRWNTSAADRLATATANAGDAEIAAIERELSELD